jgi:hypothetical protein
MIMAGSYNGSFWTRGASARAHRFSWAEQKSCSNSSRPGTDPFKQLLSKNWTVQTAFAQELIFLKWSFSNRSVQNSCFDRTALLKRAVQKDQFSNESCSNSSAPIYERTQQLLWTELELNCSIPVLNHRIFLRRESMFSDIFFSLKQ